MRTYRPRACRSNHPVKVRHIGFSSTDFSLCALSLGLAQQFTKLPGNTQRNPTQTEVCATKTSCHLITRELLSQSMTYYERNLPHWHPPGKDIFITWRLHGSLPASIKIPGANSAGSAGKTFRALDRVLDRGSSGPLWLKQPRVAECIAASLQKGHSENLFKMQAFAIMPNHVHCLLEPTVPVFQITKFIKGATARNANTILGLTGNPFWQTESFNHWIRKTAELTKA